MKRLCVALVLVSLPLAASAQNTATVTTNAPIYATEAPGPNQTPLRVAAIGTVLKVTGQDGEWVQVQFEDPQWGRRTGWVEKKLVSYVDGSLKPMDLSVREGSQSLHALSQAHQDPESPPLSHYAIEQGTTELQLSGSFTATSDAGETRWVSIVDATVGFFLTPHIEFGGNVGFAKLEDVDTTGTVTGFAAYNFTSASPVVGFVGGAVGGGFGLGDLNPFVLQVFGGVRWLTPGRRGAFLVRPFYQRNFYSDELIADTDTFGVAVGVSILF